MYSTLIRLLTYCPYCHSDTHKLENCMSNDIVHFSLECYRITRTFQKICQCNVKTSLCRWLTNQYILNSRLIYYFAIIRCRLSRRTAESEREKIISTIITSLLNEIREEDIIYLNDISTYNELYITDPVNGNTTECSICMEDVSQINMIRLLCNHEFCINCISTYINLDGEAKYCFLCRTPITNIILPET